MNLLYLPVVASICVYSIYDKSEDECDFVFLIDKNLENKFNMGIWDSQNNRLTHLAEILPITGDLYKNRLRILRSKFGNIDMNLKLMYAASKVPCSNSLRLILIDKEMDVKLCIRDIHDKPNNLKLIFSHSWLEIQILQSYIIETASQVNKLGLEVKDELDKISLTMLEEVIKNEMLTDLLLIKKDTAELYSNLDLLLKRLGQLQKDYVSEFLLNSGFLKNSKYIDYYVNDLSKILKKLRTSKHGVTQDLKILKDKIFNRNDIKVKEYYLRRIANY